ncbi:MAG: hypothetical protein COA84_05600 [Robiginitomaculum sp.]|nr:MAG: hypothetical protein COA84_05600 [Robiginitomaculum sp.]
MDALYNSALEVMDQCFEILAQSIEQPCRIEKKNSFDYRYKEQSYHQAIIQKLARIVTGLQALNLLSKAGLYQDQAALQRLQDEFCEDVKFLSDGIKHNDFTEHHKDYLKFFFQEEFDDPDSAINSTQKRGMVPRQKIRAYITKDRGNNGCQSKNVEVSRTISKLYSGYVHSASPQIMDMYYGNPPKFHLLETINSPLRQVYTDDILNYFWRALWAFVDSAEAFGHCELCDELIKYTRGFARNSGHENELRDTSQD